MPQLYQTKKDITERLNALGPDRVVKVLLCERPGEAEGPAEGVWVLIADGDKDNGIGVLLSNVVSLSGDDLPSRGDVVEYRTINPKHKPYIVKWVDGAGN